MRYIGEWTEIGRGLLGEMRFECSVCHSWNSYGKTEYCCRCGSRMTNGRKKEA